MFITVCLLYIAVQGFASGSALETYHSSNSDKVLAGIVFDESVTYTTMPNNVKYSLRVSLLDGDTNWRTDRTYPFTVSSNPRNNEATGGEPGKRIQRVPIEVTSSSKSLE